MIDKLPALARAFIILVITFITYYFHIISFEVAGVIIFVCFYNIISLFIYSYSINLIWYILDIISINLICYYTTNAFLVLYPLLLIFLIYRYQFYISGVFTVVIALLSFFILKEASIIFYSTIFGILFIQTKIIDELNNNKLKKEINNKENQIKLLNEDNERLMKKVYDETIYDPLTKLHNLKYFSLRVKEEIAKATRYNFKFSVGIFSINNFIQYYKIHGKRASDEVLKVVSMLLLAYVRNSDLVARYDNTEKFLVIFPYTDKEKSKIPITRFIEAVSRYRFDDVNPDVKLDISFGVACFPDDAQNYDKLLEKTIISLKLRGEN